VKEIVPLGVRLIATLIHLIFAIPMGCMFILLVLIWGDDNARHSVDIRVASINILFGIMMVIILPLLLPIISMTIGKIHPFIDVSCTDVSNYTLNSLIIIFSTAIVFIVAGTSRAYIFVTKSGVDFFVTSLIVINVIATAYFINSIVSAIYTLSGFRFKNRLICPFFEG
jgi:hypothetical protein